MAFGQNVQEHSLNITGALTTSSIGVRRFNNRYRIMQTSAAVGTAVTTATMVTDLQIARSATPTSFASIFDSADTKPSIASGATVGLSTPPTSIPNIEPGDLIKIVLTGSFAAATDLNVTLLLQPA